MLPLDMYAFKITIGSNIKKIEKICAFLIYLSDRNRLGVLRPWKLIKVINWTCNSAFKCAPFSRFFGAFFKLCKWLTEHWNYHARQVHFGLQCSLVSMYILYIRIRNGFIYCLSEYLKQSFTFCENDTKC